MRRKVEESVEQKRVNARIENSLVASQQRGQLGDRFHKQLFNISRERRFAFKSLALVRRPKEQKTFQMREGDSERPAVLPFIRVIPRQLQLGISEQAQYDNLSSCALMVAARVAGQVLAPGPLLARPLRRFDRLDEVEGDEVDELGLCNFAEKRRIEVRTELREEMHNARQVALVVVRLLSPFEPDVE